VTAKVCTSDVKPKARIHEIKTNIDSSQSHTPRSFSYFPRGDDSFFYFEIFLFTYYNIVQAVPVDIRRSEAVAEVRADLAAGQIVQVRQVRVVENNLNKNNSISLSRVHQRLKGVGGRPDQDMASF
jgi:hypothetical protein